MEDEIESNFKYCFLEKNVRGQSMDDGQRMYEKDRKHSEASNLRVDKKTYLGLISIVKQRGISRAGVCRGRSKGPKYEPSLLAEDGRVASTKQLNQISNNLNQAVKTLNIIAKCFREESESKKEKSLHFSLDVSRYSIFKDELTNSIAKELMTSYSDNIFLESSRGVPSSFKSLEVEEGHFEHWIEKQARPGMKEEYFQKVDRSLIHSI